MLPSLQACCYAVTTDGKCVRFAENVWHELHDEVYAELRFKRISCSLHTLWALAGDHQVHSSSNNSAPPTTTRKPFPHPPIPRNV